MKKTLLALTLVGFLVGCGGGSGISSEDVGNDTEGQGTPNPSENVTHKDQKLQDLSTFHKDSIIKSVKNANFQNIMEDVAALSTENYIAYYKRMNALKFMSIPDLNITFSLKKDEKVSKQSRKLIYENTWSRKDEHNCINGGVVSKEVKLSPRGHLEADTYMSGDYTNYDYERCDIGSVIYDGKVEYKVGQSNSNTNDIEIDFTFGSTPLGSFDSVFHDLSIESDKQKITLNGTIRFDAKADKTPKPNSKLERLEKKYDTVGDLTITAYDKDTDKTIKLIYNGTLENIIYQKGYTSNTGSASVIDLGVLGEFLYRKTSNYTLRVERDGKLFTLSNNNNLSGTTDDDGNMLPPRPMGYDLTNSSYMTISDHTIQDIVLADGTSKYILDLNSDWYPEDSKIVGTPQHALPPIDIDLMHGVVVIGYDTCVPTNLLRERLASLGIEYNYINMKATQEAHDLFVWFHIKGVPYLGVNGSYFGGSFYDKNMLSIYLSSLDYRVDDTLVKQAHKNVNLHGATFYFKEMFDELQIKDKHTAMAVTNDTLNSYNKYRVWGESSAQEAKDKALKKCEQRRKDRKDKGKKEIFSQCRLYSVDGVIQPNSTIRDLP